MAIEMKKTKVKMNKPIYLGMSILDISKMLMYEFWSDYVEPKYQDKAKLCYMDTEYFFIHIKTKDLYKDITKDGLTHQNTAKMIKDCFQYVRIKK